MGKRGRRKGAFVCKFLHRRRRRIKGRVYYSCAFSVPRWNLWYVYSWKWNTLFTPGFLHTAEIPITHWLAGLHNLTLVSLINRRADVTSSSQACTNIHACTHFQCKGWTIFIRLYRFYTRCTFTQNISVVEELLDLKLASFVGQGTHGRRDVSSQYLPGGSFCSNKTAYLVIRVLRENKSILKWLPPS